LTTAKTQPKYPRHFDIPFVAVGYGSIRKRKGYFYFMAKPPAFLLYVSDFLGGTDMLTAAQVGGYIRLLCKQWDKNCLPFDKKILKKWTELSNKDLDVVLEKFVKNEHGYINERLEQERQKQEHHRLSRSEAGKIGNQKRWAKESHSDSKSVANESQNNRLSISITSKEKQSKEKAHPIFEKANLQRQWDIPFMPDFIEKILKHPNGKAALSEISELWDTWIAVRYKAHNKQFTSDISEAQALKTLISKCKGSTQVIESIKRMIIVESVNPFTVDIEKAKDEKETITHFGIAANRLG
jgi:uncharacterized protein YdaU (DUF1376 family)